MNETFNQTFLDQTSFNQTVIENNNETMNGSLTCDIDNKIDISEHYLYLILNILVILAFSLPTSKSYLVYLHLLLTAAYSMQCFWSWDNICGSNLFTWSIVFTILNAFNSIKLLIQTKEVTFSVGLLNDAYSTIFEPMAMTKSQIKKLFSTELAKIVFLEKGEAYALENNSKTDKLSLLLSGIIIVTSGENQLHTIKRMEFLDSPEFQSSKTSDEKFRVSLLAETDCKILTWQKSTLQYFLGKETFLAQIFNIVLSNDISNKLFLMNEKIQFYKGNYLDIRKTLFLPSISIINDKSDDESNCSFPYPIKLTNKRSPKN